MPSCRRFPVIAAGTLAAFLIWALHFTVIYAVHALACARDLAPERVALAVGVATVAALTAAGGVLAGALWRRVHAAAPEEPDRFLAWLTAASAGLALVAILWNGLPALQVPVCS